MRVDRWVGYGDSQDVSLPAKEKGIRVWGVVSMYDFNISRLVKCKLCGGKVLSKAQSCPH